EIDLCTSTNSWAPFQTIIIVPSRRKTGTRPAYVVRHVSDHLIVNVGRPIRVCERTSRRAEEGVCHRLHIIGIWMMDRWPGIPPSSPFSTVLYKRLALV